MCGVGWARGKEMGKKKAEEKSGVYLTRYPVRSLFTTVAYTLML